MITIIDYEPSGGEPGSNPIQVACRKNIPGKLNMSLLTLIQGGIKCLK